MIEKGNETKPGVPTWDYTGSNVSDIHGLDEMSLWTQVVQTCRRFPWDYHIRRRSEHQVVRLTNHGKWQVEEWFEQSYVWLLGWKSHHSQLLFVESLSNSLSLISLDGSICIPLNLDHHLQPTTLIEVDIGKRYQVVHSNIYFVGGKVEILMFRVHYKKKIQY